MSTISIHRSYRSGQSVRARRRTYAEAISATSATRILRAQRALHPHPATGVWRSVRRSMRWLAYTLLRCTLRRHRPDRLTSVTPVDAFWDTWAIQLELNQSEQRRQRMEHLDQYAAMQQAVDSLWPAGALSGGEARDDAHWRDLVRALYERLGVVVEAHEERATPELAPSVRFAVRDVTPAYRAALTRPTLDALLLGSDDDATALARPHDAMTQPALEAIHL